MLYRALVRPLLFRMDPETAHHVALWALRVAGGVPGGTALLKSLFDVEVPQLEQEIWGLRFRTPIGLAAGFDKNARVVRALMNLGFGFMEVGAVSSVARPGNPRPRIFRLPDDRGLINRMGLPNDGAKVIASRLATLGPRRIPVFANIVKTSDLEGDIRTMAQDYVTTLREVLPHVDGVSVNVSCPASPELATFNRAEAMFELLDILGSARREILAASTKTKPMLLKVSPDLDDVERDVVAEAATSGRVDGLILTNTTTSRPTGLVAPASTLSERGGLSGAPLHTRSIDCLKDFVRRTAGRVPIVGVGGIMSVDDARRFLDAGARLVEIYTGYVYEGPSFPRRLAAGLLSQRWRPISESVEGSGDAQLATP